MSVGYQLVNLDKEEIISFHLIDTGLSVRELSGTTISGSIISYYLLTNTGDRITFVNDQDSKFNLFGSEYTWDDFHKYTDVTAMVVEELIKNQIIKEVGIRWIDKEENLHYRDLINVWDPKFEWNK